MKRTRNKLALIILLITGIFCDALADTAEFTLDDLDGNRVSFEEIPSAEARAFLQPFDINYPNLKIGDTPLVPFEPLEGLPTTAIVDPGGRIVERHMGPVTAAHLKDIIDRHRSLHQADRP